KEKNFVRNCFSVKFLPSTRSPSLAAVDPPPAVDQISVPRRRQSSTCRRPVNRHQFFFLLYEIMEVEEKKKLLKIHGSRSRLNRRQHSSKTDGGVEA
ncbi:hypothetical protein A2U01_0022776, partial [Trifolium medium]|nr:hypothetical protein [Trifolium medium]